MKATSLSVTLTDSLGDYLGERAEACVVPWERMEQEVWTVVAASSSLPIGLMNKNPQGARRLTVRVSQTCLYWTYQGNKSSQDKHCHRHRPISFKLENRLDKTGD